MHLESRAPRGFKDERCNFLNDSLTSLSRCEALPKGSVTGEGQLMELIARAKIRGLTTPH